MLARPRARSTTKIRLKNSLYPHSHFTENLVDAFEKSPQECTAVSIAKVFFDNIIMLHSISCSIVSDHDPIFTSIFWTEIFRLSEVQLRMSTAFHPQTDDQSELTNKILGVYLRCLIGDQPHSWLRWLPWAEYCYNTSFQMALQATPLGGIRL
jgi:hypothetical protein